MKGDDYDVDGEGPTAFMVVSEQDLADAFESAWQHATNAPSQPFEEGMKEGAEWVVRYLEELNKTR